MALPFPKKKNNFNTLINNDQEGFWWKKAWRQGKKALAKANKPLQSRGLLFEALEPRVLMSADLSYGGATDLTLTFDGIQTYSLVDQANTTVNSADTTDGIVTITGTGGNDSLRLSQNMLPGLAITFLGGGQDSLIGQDSGQTWTLTGIDAGNLAGVGFTGMERLVGGNGDDSFKLDPSGVFTGSIDGGGGDDSITAAAGGTNFTISGEDSGTAGAASFSHVENLSGGAQTDTFSFSSGGTLTGLVDGGGGADQLVAPNTTNTWSITALREGNLNGDAFTEIETLTGGAAADTFQLESDVTSFGGAINGGSGNDMLIAANGVNVWAITAANAGTLNGSTTFTQIETLSGGSDTDTLTGPITGQTWTLTGGDAGNLPGAEFSGMEHLVGGTADDVFRLADSFAGSIDGGGGNDTLAGANADTEFSITGANSGVVGDATFTGIENLSGGTQVDRFRFSASGSLSGTVDGGGGIDDSLVNERSGNILWTIAGTNTGTVAGVNLVNLFIRVENLQGSNGEDEFVFANGAARVDGRLDGGGGRNTLNYSAYTSNVTVNFSTDEATGTGGMSGITDVIGGQGNSDTLVGPDGDVTWNLEGDNSGNVADNITFESIENLTGADGNDDTFVVKQYGRLSGRLDGGAGGYDKLVFDKNGSVVTYAPSVPDSGTINLGWVSIDYAGLEPGKFLPASNPLQLFTDFSDARNIKIAGNPLAGNDLHLTTYSPGTPNLLQISSAFDDPLETVIFNSPADSLTITMGGIGNNTLTIGEPGGSITLGDPLRWTNPQGGLTIRGGVGKNTVEQVGNLVIGPGGLTIDGKGGVKDEITLSGTIEVNGGDVLIEGSLFTDTITLDGTLELAGGALTVDGSLRQAGVTLTINGTDGSPQLQLPLVQNDQVTLGGLVETQGGDVTVDAARITVAGGTVSTRQFDLGNSSVSTGVSGDIFFTGVTIVLEPGSVLQADVAAAAVLRWLAMSHWTSA